MDRLKLMLCPPSLHQEQLRDVQEIFATHGILIKLVIDNGKSIKSEELQAVCQGLWNKACDFNTMAPINE